MNPAPEIIPFTKFNSKRMTELNVKCNAIKRLEDNMGQNLVLLGESILFRYSPKDTAHERNDKLDFIKVFHPVKDNRY